ncbi:septal ring lytic transglycosylase RlpA family protein [Basfia succiniciproducens]|uniref:septal ring lytic transglycosylase RlpA family protein n=1 Tax=Basfia succiniciproducens TaxID=653940 RepID=UPI0008B7EEF3|nr:septal ring lytic transglycosylase RlpA family protein [Basfia succiniciproducens]SEQ44493.1 rare lipoprotein A [Basfia succiniciproducens]
MKLKFLLTVLLAVMTTACSASSNTAQVNNTKKHYGIAGPKLEHKGAAKSSNTYVVNGRKYTTQTSRNAKNYSKEGKASYYHNKFHGRRTASGEKYSNQQYTAAHKTLPLGSYALVTNLRNNKKVIVRINDRGPFSKTRIMDLSHAAANELGLIRAGVGNVRVEALHVDRSGQISGAGASTLVRNARTDEARDRIK